MAAQRLSGVEVMAGLDLGSVVVTVVTTTTLAVQLIGPPFVKFAITRCGEIGRNVTEEDIIAEDAMAQIQDVVRADMPLAEAIAILRQIGAEETIVRDATTEKVVGIFDLRSARRSITQRLLQRQGGAA
jgi:hypothetical protein